MTHLFVEQYPTDERRAQIRAEQLLPTYFDTTPEAQKTRIDAVGLFNDPAFSRFIEEAEVNPHALPDGYIEWLGKQGLTSLELPFGLHNGWDATHLEQAVIMEEAARKHPGLALDIVVANSLTTFELFKFGTEEQKEKYLKGISDGTILGAYALTEPGHGSDAKGIETKAVHDDERHGWVLNGDKTFITLAEDADFLVVAAKTDVEEKRGENITVFLVDKKETKGITLHNREKLGQAGSPLYDIHFADAFIPDSAVLGGPDMVHKGWSILESVLGHSRTWIASQGVGLAQACYDSALEYAKTRPMYFGTELIDLPKAHNMFRVMNEQIIISRKLVQLAAYYEDTKHPKASVVASLAKLVSCSTAQWAANEAMLLFGGAGYMKAQKEIVSLFLASPVLRAYEGSEPVQEGILNKHGFSADEISALRPPKIGDGYSKSPEKLGMLLPWKIEQLIRNKMGAIGNVQLGFF